jgi:CRP-like cAMP-binding protein
MTADSVETSSAIARQLFLRTFSAGVPLGNVAAQLSRLMRDEVFPAGATLYRRGEASNRIFFLVKGRVSLSMEGMPPWVFEAGTSVGLLDVLQDRSHKRTATALSDVRALSLAAEDYFDVLEDNFEFTRNSIVKIAAALHALRLSLMPSGGFGAATDAIPVSRGRLTVEPYSDPLRAAFGMGGGLPVRPLNLVERTIALREVPALRSSSIQALTSMAGLIEERGLKPGEVLFKQGDPAAAIYIVVRGLLELERIDPLIMATFGERTLVGGFASLGSSDHPYTARARDASTVLALDKEDLFDLLELHFELVRSIFAGVAAEREQVLFLKAAQHAEENRGAADSLFDVESAT